MSFNGIKDLLQQRLQQQGGKWNTGLPPSWMQGFAQPNTPKMGPIKPGPSSYTNQIGNALSQMQGYVKDQLPSSPTDPQSEYDRLTGEYNAQASDYDRSVRNLSYSKQAYDRRGRGWDQLEQQRNSGGGYGGNRFYHQGEIYNYDPEAGNYRGSISGQLLAQQGAYQAPALAPNPGTYEDYMADDPYYQTLQEQNASPTVAPEAVDQSKPPRPSNFHIWNEKAGVWQRTQSNQVNDDMRG